MNILNVKSAEIKPCQDLDIVAVSESQCEARTATPDALDSPPAMPDSRLPIMQTSPVTIFLYCTPYSVTRSIF